MDGRWLVEGGADGCAVSDLDPPRGDAGVVQWVFIRGELDVVGVHRRCVGRDGPCEHVPPERAPGPPPKARELAERAYGPRGEH